MNAKRISVLFVLLTLGLSAKNILLNDWRLAAFLNTDSNSIQVTPQANSLQLKIIKEVKDPGENVPKGIFSIYQALPPCDHNGILELTFEARCLSKRPFYLLIAVGASPGRCPPGTSETAKLGEDWKNYQISLPLTGINTNSIFEFIWEGVMVKGDTLEIRNITLQEDESNSTAHFYIQNPVNLELDSSFSGAITGAIFPLRSQEKGDYSIKVMNELAPDNAIIQVSGNLARPFTTFEIDASKITDKGKYILDLQITSTSGKVTSEKSNLWKTNDNTNRTYIKNNTYYLKGSPHIPIGLFHAGLWNMDRANEISVKLGGSAHSYAALYEDIADRGFNCVHSVLKPDGSDLDVFAKAAAMHNLKILPTIHTDISIVFPENLLGWYGGDEASSGAAQQLAREIYLIAKNREPKSCIFAANYITDITETMKRSGCFADVILFDRYVIRTKNQDFSEYAEDCKKIGQLISQSPHFVFGCTPQAFIYNGPEPTFEQVKLQIYLAMIHGAKAFLYYSYNEDYDHRTDFTERKYEFPEIPAGMSKNKSRKNWFLPESFIWDKIGELNKEISALEKFIINNGEKVQITVSATPAQFAVKKVEGVVYLIIANPKAEEIQPIFKTQKTYNFRGLFDDSNVSVSHSGTTIPLKSYEVKVLVADE